MKTYYLKTNRTFSFIRKYGWIFTILVAIGGLWIPKLGLLVLPVMISLIAVAFFNGRYWCGNFCPHGSLYDSIFINISPNKKIPNFFKWKFLRLLFLLWFGFNIVRKLYNIYSNISQNNFLDRLGFIFVGSYLMVLILGGLLSIFITPRTWCHFCPMGIMQNLSHKLGTVLGVTKITEKKVTISQKDSCINCGKCSRVCPMQLTVHQQFNSKNQFENNQCIKCTTCVVNCPKKLLSLNNKNISA